MQFTRYAAGQYRSGHPSKHGANKRYGRSVISRLKSALSISQTPSKERAHDRAAVTEAAEELMPGWPAG